MAKIVEIKMCLLCVRIIKHKIGKKHFFLVKEVTFCDFFFLQLKFRWCITREEFIIELKSKCKIPFLKIKKKKHIQVELSSFEKEVIRTPGMQRYE